MGGLEREQRLPDRAPSLLPPRQVCGELQGSCSGVFRVGRASPWQPSMEEDEGQTGGQLTWDEGWRGEVLTEVPWGGEVAAPTGSLLPPCKDPGMLFQAKIYHEIPS